MFASPVRINNVIGIYASCLHSLMQRDTTHLCIVNAGRRSAKIVKDTVIAIYAPVTTNMAYAFLNITDMSLPNSKKVDWATVPLNYRSMRSTQSTTPTPKHTILFLSSH